jgi:hypothetical protein
MHPGLAEPRTKEDWRAYLDYEPPGLPELPPPARYQAMSQAQRRGLDTARDAHHSALVLAWTPPVRRFENEIFELLTANEYAPAGARPGLLIDGPATVGKSTLVKMIARKFELQLRDEHPERFVDQIGDYVPVVYLSVPDAVTPKQISLALARYLHVPTKGTKDDIDHVILKALRRCGTQLLIIADLHFLDCSYKEGRASNDHIKYLANHAPCTIVGTGVDLTESPLLSEGSGTDRNTQTAGRFAHHKLHRFAIATAADRTEWVTVVKTPRGRAGALPPPPAQPRPDPLAVPTRTHRRQHRRPAHTDPPRRDPCGARRYRGRHPRPPRRDHPLVHQRTRVRQGRRGARQAATANREDAGRHRTG